jgi:hypothetical protein
MKALNMSPNDKRATGMNLPQWLWCYQNIIEDQKEEQERFKGHLDRLAFIINPDTARTVFDYEEKEKNKKNKNGKSKKFKIDAVYGNDEFEIEARAAMMGYDPSSGISAEEFIAQKVREKSEKDILEEDFDSMLDGLEEEEVTDGSLEYGYSYEEPEDFFERAMRFQDSTLEEDMYDEDIDENDLDVFEVYEDE